MRRHAFMGRMICYSIIFFAYLASSIFALIPMIADKDVQVNISNKNQAVNLPMPLTWVFGDLNIPTSLFLLIFVMQFILLLISGASNCGNKQININIKEIKFH